MLALSGSPGTSGSFASASFKNPRYPLLPPTCPLRSPCGAGLPALLPTRPCGSPGLPVSASQPLPRAAPSTSASHTRAASETGNSHAPSPPSSPPFIPTLPHQDQHPVIPPPCLHRPLPTPSLNPTALCSAALLAPQRFREAHRATPNSARRQVSTSCRPAPGLPEAAGEIAEHRGAGGKPQKPEGSHAQGHHAQHPISYSDTVLGGRGGGGDGQGKV